MYCISAKMGQTFKLLKGGGFDCSKNSTDGDGLWSNVASHIAWIREQMKPDGAKGNTFLNAIFLCGFSTGFVELRGGDYEFGNRLYSGNVFVDGEAICDDEWGDEEAYVVCRLDAEAKAMFKLCKNQIVVKNLRNVAQ